MAGIYTLTVSDIPPPDLGDTYVGTHVYLEIPDQSATANFTVGTNVVGDGSTTTGAWTVQDLGRYTGSGPWTITGPAPFGFDDTKNTPCRLY